MNNQRKKFAKFRKKSKPVCYFCKEIIPRKKMTVEHLLPRSRGGTNEESNLAIACASCNTEKDNMTLQEYEIYKNLLDYLRDLSDKDLLKLRDKYKYSSQYTHFSKDQKEHYIRNFRAVKSVIKKRNELKVSV